MNEIAAWLATAEGIKWSRRQFNHEPLIYHDLIEIIDDYAIDIMMDHASMSSDGMLQLMREQEHTIWGDLTWTPDRPP